MIRRLAVFCCRAPSAGKQNIYPSIAPSTRLCIGTRPVEDNVPCVCVCVCNFTAVATGPRCRMKTRNRKFLEYKMVRLFFFSKREVSNKKAVTIKALSAIS